MSKKISVIIYIVMLVCTVVLVMPYITHYQVSSYSEPMNKKLSALIAEGKQKIYLTELMSDKPWTCACLHEEYHSVKDSIRLCSRTKIQDSTSAKSLTQIDITPANHTAYESEYGVIFINDYKEAWVFLPSLRLEGKVWPCHSKQEAYLEVKKYGDEVQLRLNSERSFL